MPSLTRLTVLLAIAGFVCGPARAQPGGRAVMPLFTLPECKNYQYIVPLSSETAPGVTGPQGRLYCTDVDFPSAARESAPVMAALKAETGNRQIRRIAVSAYIFSEPSYAAWLCSLNYAPNAEITVLAQRTAGGRGRIADAFYNELDKCPAAPHYVYFGCSVFDDDDSDGPDTHACRAGAVNTLHLKSLLVDFADGSQLALVGSGNVNRSLYANIEDWLLIRAASPVNALTARLQCMFDAAAGNSGNAPDGKKITRDWLSCMSAWGTLPAMDQVKLDFAPIAGPSYRQQLIEAVASADQIDIMAQAVEDRGLIDAVLGNSRAQLRIIADDDWYWAQRQNSDFYTASIDKIRWVSQVDKSNVRYLQTNHDQQGGLGNTLHTRQIQVVKAGVRTIFTGSAHFRAGSLLLNVEQLFVITDQNVAASYGQFFDRVWGRGVEWRNMPLAPAPVK